MRNANEPGEVTPQRLKITTCGLKECIQEVSKRLDWDHKKKGPKNEGRGVGMASLIHVGGGARVYKSDGCGTIVKVDDFGAVDVFTGSTDMGQGADTVIAQMVAEEMGVLPEDVNILDRDTDVSPWDVGAHASRTTFVAGNSAVMAARRVRERILNVAAGFVDRWKDKQGNKHEIKLDSDPKNLTIKERMIYSVKEPEKKIALSKILRGAHYEKNGTMIMAEAFYDPDNENLDREFKGNMSKAYSYGAHGVEVQVDKETGKVKILKYVAAHDVGRAINPMLLEGQVYGGTAMGVGYALTERLILEKGEVMNPNFRDYKMLTAKDVIPVEPVIVETIDEAGPFGAKGIGEPGLVPSAPAIANAIYDAIGVRLKELPMTPERVLKAIKEKKGQ
jgi:xanthine dehydrogenase molybdenum-binding subunit